MSSQSSPEVTPKRRDLRLGTRLCRWTVSEQPGGYFGRWITTTTYCDLNPANEWWSARPKVSSAKLALKAKVEKKPKQINLTEWYNEANEDREDEKKLARYYELGDEVFIWKLREFGLTESKVDDTMRKAAKYKGLILDLRANRGGFEETLKRMVGYFFNRDIVLGVIKRRKESKAFNAKTRGNKAFPGKLIVLIDSQSGSAAELFARVIQLEKRGTIIGDLSAGAVMRSIFRPGLLGDMSSGNMIA